MINNIKKQIGENIYSCQVTGNGEPLVLLHGFTSTSKTWKTFMDKWASAFKVIAIDLPGHGKTETPDFPTMTGFCDELKELLQMLQVNRCHLLGYSMGGRIALSFAQRHPSFVQSLILESASPGLETEAEREERRRRDQDLANKLINEGLEVFVNGWEELPLFASQKLLSNEVKDSIRNERLNQSEYGLSKSLTKMGIGSQPSWWKRLASLQMPIQLIVGSLDEKFVRINQLMEESINQSELIIVHEAGHAVHVEQAEKFATIVMEFLYLKNT